MSYRQKILKFKLIRSLSSLKITLVCLFLLYLLTLGGMVSQIHEGLYLAQQRYFESFVFLLFGFLPFPGAQAVMWVLLVNLVCVALTRFVYQWRRVGILIIHSGLLLFLVSAYLTLHQARESHLTLSEGQAANVSVAYHDWELAIWEAPLKEDSSLTDREVVSLDTNRFHPNQTIELVEQGFRISVKEFYKNCEAFSEQDSDAPLNASGITHLQSAALQKEPEKNKPGGVFSVTTGDQKTFDILLFGAETRPVTIKAGAKRYHAILRLKRFPLPFVLRLKDFRKEEHPGTTIARSFQSLVEVQPLEGKKFNAKAWREKLIAMNEPLRYKDFTLYQASFSVDESGQESSTLAVVQNAGRLMPYISTLVTVLGLVTHFSMMAVHSRKNTTNRKRHD